MPPWSAEPDPRERRLAPESRASVRAAAALLAVGLVLACGGLGAELPSTEAGPPVRIAADVPSPPGYVSLDLGPVEPWQLGEAEVGWLLSVGTEPARPGEVGTWIVHRAEIVDTRSSDEGVVITVYAVEPAAEALLSHRGPVLLHAEIPWGIEPD